MTSKRSLTLKPSILTASILFIAVLTVLSAARPAQAQTETVLYNFTGGSDGAHPQSRLTADGKGNFYGTTYQGGLLDLGPYLSCRRTAPEVGTRLCSTASTGG